MAHNSDERVSSHAQMDVANENVMRAVFRTLKYAWASPNTLLGLLFAIHGKASLVNGVIEIHGPLTRWALDHAGPCRGASAMTLGHVVIGQDQAALNYSREHERIHVRQYESFGPFFIPMYFFCSFHAWRIGRDPYRDNFFEVEAYDDRSGKVPGLKCRTTTPVLKGVPRINAPRPLD